MTSDSKNIGRLARWVLIGLALVLGFAAGFVLRGHLGAATRGPHAGRLQDAESQAESSEIWTCSMHPQIRRNGPGQCPICGMDLVPLSQTTAGRRELQISEEAARLLRIQTQPVARRLVTAEVRMVGKVDYDETRVKTITAYVGGRLDRLFVDSTGITVRPGDHLVELYSPELISAQAEYLQALKATKDLAPGSSDFLATSTQATLDAAADKLRLLGLTAEQIKQIEQTGRAVDHLTIYAPRGGVVIEKNAHEGMYVQTGTRIYTIADLDRLWVNLDAYESDLQWLRYGQEVEFTTEAYPGRIFTGLISFIDPVLNDRTRTAKVRVIVDNPDRRLKPNLFVRAIVRASVAAGGQVVDPRLADKYVCPMHPEIIKDAPGTCDVCRMDLVKTTDLGYVSAESAGPPPLVIPATAPLITGKRAVVYTTDPASEVPTFTLQQVRLGPRAGDYYIVLDGLQEGQHVVTHGAFKIDSEMQIRGKISMMNPEPDDSAAEADNGQRTGPDAELRAASADADTAPGVQTICPVMGNPINKDIFIEYEGKTVYFCCPACIETFQADPQKYIGKLPQFAAASDSASASPEAHPPGTLKVPDPTDGNHQGH